MVRQFARAVGTIGRPFPRSGSESGSGSLSDPGCGRAKVRTDVLVHTDLHYLNILFRLDADGFAAIDAQPQVGEAEFAVAPALGTEFRNLIAGSLGGPCWTGRSIFVRRPIWTRKSRANGAWHARWTMPFRTSRNPGTRATPTVPLGGEHHVRQSA